MTGHTVVSSVRVKNLFEAATVEEVKERMAQLRPESERQWGKMNPAQMLAHCSATIEMAMGKTAPPRILIGRLLGRLAKKSVIVNRTPMRRNSMTEKSCLVTDERDFVVEKQRLREIDRPLCNRRARGMHEASAFLFRAADSCGMGGVDVSAPGSSSAAVSGLVPGAGQSSPGFSLTSRLCQGWRFRTGGGSDFRGGLNFRVRTLHSF